MSVPAMSPVRQGAEAFIQGSATLLNSTDGLTRISEFTLSVFSLFEHFFKTLPDGVLRFGKSLDNFLDLTPIVSIAKRCKNWFVSDKDGKMLWHKAWYKITSTSCLTAANAISFIKFLSTTLKVFELGKALLPLSIASNALTAGFALFDLVDSANDLNENFQHSAKMKHGLKKWEGRVKTINPDDFKELVAKQQVIWTNKAAVESPEKEKAVAKLKQWTDASKLTSDAEIKEFCSKKVSQINTVLENNTGERTKSWLTIANNIALIALMALSIALTFVIPPAGLILATLLTAVATSGLDVAGFFAEQFIKPKDVKAVTV